jgi:hypothetical protein
MKDALRLHQDTITSISSSSYRKAAETKNTLIRASIRDSYTAPKSNAAPPHYHAVSELHARQLASTPAQPLNYATQPPSASGHRIRLMNIATMLFFDDIYAISDYSELRR